MTIAISQNFRDQAAHVGWGYIFVTAPAMLFHVKWWILVVGVIVLTGAKEYADSHGLETPDVAGNSWEDWGFWCVGALLGLAVLVFSGQVKL
jgi:hypothetical protein